MKDLELLKEKFEHYQVRKNMIQKFYYYTENVNGYWDSFTISVKKIVPISVLYLLSHLSMLYIKLLKIFR